MSDARFIDLESIPKLDANEMAILWVNDWYDGPIEAVVEYRGERALFVLHDHDVLGSDEPWCWVLFRLSPEALAEEEAWQRLFVEHVSDSWDWTGKEHPKPSGRHEEFYTKYRERPERPLQQYEPLGWVDAMPVAKARKQT